MVCPYCYGRGVVGPEGAYCPHCGVRLDVSESPTIRVEGQSSDEVRDVSIALLKHMERSRAPQVRSPWLSGSFYLACFVIIVGLCLVIARVVHPLLLPPIIIAALLAVSVVGALQLRHDSSLSEKSFLVLMALTFKQLPFIRKKEISSAPESAPHDSKG